MPEQLTREAVLAMPAGREMDEMVAERVMGILARDVRVCGSDETVTVWTDNPAIADGEWSARELKGWYGAPPEYSTDIAEAWLVVQWVESHPDAAWLLMPWEAKAYRFASRRARFGPRARTGRRRWLLSVGRHC